ncbi:hypothetical protein [Achromobacter phage Motura]|uniref:Uncharacterized protein n=1 Tax=Achromobacter phage Motura TaxID=2591403 RepID=A0A514CT15_9CAUD|nr:hypothetical protein H1O15_gp175 [Achromobacter phage Motura]QDH83613.1 hypothetical protein [Achromobacter phage Motura]
MTYEIQAATRLEALKPPSSSKKAWAFYSKLGPKERSFLALELPPLLAQWFRGSFTKQNKTQRLTSHLTAKKYHKVDAIAVALGHIKQAFPFKVPKVLYRATHVNKEQMLTPVGGTLELNAKTTRSPILSFADEKPTMFEESDNLTIEWKVDPRLVLGDFHWMVQICSMFKNMFDDLMHAHDDRESDDSDPYINFYSQASDEWEDALSEIEHFEKEREFIVFIPGNESLTVKVIRNPFALNIGAVRYWPKYGNVVITKVGPKVEVLTNQMKTVVTDVKNVMGTDESADYFMEDLSKENRLKFEKMPVYKVFKKGLPKGYKPFDFDGGNDESDEWMQPPSFKKKTSYKGGGPAKSKPSYKWGSKSNTKTGGPGGKKYKFH